MDLSALIFVALAVAWAAYLVPKALKHHDDVRRSRSVDNFSDTMRVLARREPVNRRTARLVVSPSRQDKTRTTSAAVAPTDGSSAAAGNRTTGAHEQTEVTVRRVPPRVSRPAARSAARRRRNVLATILIANIVVAALAVGNAIGWVWTAIPATLLVAWLVACRLMVKSERQARRSVAVRTTADKSESADALDETQASMPAVAGSDGQADRGQINGQADEGDLGASTPSVVAERGPGAWDMVPTTLPTYVSKPAAVRRTVQTIDLESTGVWSSGRTDSDSELARAAEQEEAERKAAQKAAEKIQGDEVTVRKVSGA